MARKPGNFISCHFARNFRKSIHTKNKDSKILQRSNAKFLNLIAQYSIKNASNSFLFYVLNDEKLII